MVVAIPMIDPAQFRGVVVVPSVVLFRLNGMRLLNAASQRFYQPVFQLRPPLRPGTRHLDMFVGYTGRVVGLFFAVVAPRHVVKRAAPISDTPMSNDAFGIEFERLSKAPDPLRLVEGKAPVQTQ